MQLASLCVFYLALVIINSFYKVEFMLLSQIKCHINPF